MAGKPETTQTLRAKLFDAIDDLAAGKIESRDAMAIAKLSAEIIKTAELEIRYAKELAALDSGDSGINPGPLLLTDSKSTDAPKDQA